MAQNMVPYERGLHQVPAMTPNTDLLSISLPAPYIYAQGRQGMVKVLVGKRKTEFWVHKQLISSQSEVFSAWLDHDLYPVGTTHEIRLKDDDPEIFAVIVNWLYTGKVIWTREGLGTVELAYLLADKLRMEAAKDVFLDHIIQYEPDMVTTMIPHGTLREEDIPQDCNLRKFIVDQSAHNWTVNPEVYDRVMQDDLRRYIDRWFDGPSLIAREIKRKISSFKKVLKTSRRSRAAYASPAQSMRAAYFEQDLAGPLQAGDDRLG